MQQEKPKTHIRQSEAFIRALATRCGFRDGDFSLVWDDGEFQASRSTHDLAIVTADGRRSTAQISHSALVRQDPWQYIRQLDAALVNLARRGESRGL
jgi:hypothetical protein